MKQDPKCQTLKIDYAKPEQLPIVLLASHEGGGADWLRKVLEVVSGYFCGTGDKQKQVKIRNTRVKFN